MRKIDVKTDAKKNYFEIINLLDELNVLFLKSLKNNMDRTYKFEVTPTQAMIVYRINNRILSINDIIKEGYYKGANVTYNLRKLDHNGYISKTLNHYDGRSTLIGLTDKGRSLWENIDSVIMSQAEMLTSYDLDDTSINDLIDVLGKIDFLLRNFKKKKRKNNEL